MSLRIFALSDQHGYLDVKLPTNADLILHAGDICPDYFPSHYHGSTLQANWLKKRWLPWVADFNVKATLGNHDFLSRHDIPRCVKIDTLMERDGLTIWFSPWSPKFNNWAWMADEDILRVIYNAIPTGTDIIVSHCPPYNYGDKIADQFILDDRMDPHVGSKALLDTICRVRPKVVICGHIHGGHGIYTHNTTTIYNCSLVDEDYRLVHPLMEIPL